ncbi:winged helix-turn-helix transcriptional regulator [Candidatus Woesearchaeota archaeon]|nr:winged helix-turn-helix transcriptional regulator [Candidatus Woesearchaeota archaeon]
MNNKKLGVVFLTISVIVSFILIYIIMNLNTESRELGCFDNEGCLKIESTFNITHLAFGVIGFILALGIYLIFFSKSEEEILKQLKENKASSLKEEKFNLVLKGLDDYEKKAMKAVKEQDGITQNTLRIRTDMSKAKLSYVLQDLEKRGLIKRIKKGKTLAVFLKENF